MLYERWVEVARARRRLSALRDLATGQSWTFGSLLETTETSQGQGAVAHPIGHGAGFVLEVLQAWRSAVVVCPLEPGQDPPTLKDLPGGIVHVKTTSATTGTPRFVLFSAKQLKADADNIVQTMGLREDWPNLGVISLAHSYGFSNLVLPLLL